MKTNKGFTLVELLVVLAIIGVLFTLIMPAIDLILGTQRAIWASDAWSEEAFPAPVGAIDTRCR